MKDSTINLKNGMDESNYSFILVNIICYLVGVHDHVTESGNYAEKIDLIKVFLKTCTYF